MTITPWATPLVLCVLLGAQVAADDDERFTFWRSEGFREVLHLNTRGDRLEQREDADADAILSLNPRIHSHTGKEHRVPIPESFTHVDVFRISDFQQVVGMATRPFGDPRGSQMGLVRNWGQASTQLLSPPASYRDSTALDITADGNTVCGLVVGRDPPRVQPAVWYQRENEWTCQVLDTDQLYNPMLVSGRVAISDDGRRVVATISTTLDDDSRAGRNRLCQWERASDGSWKRTILSDHAVRVADVNNHGMVVGRITTRERRQGYVFDPAKGPLILDPLPGDDNVEATALNNHGVVVGISDDPPGPEGGTEAFVWWKGTMQRIEFPGEEIFSSAQTILDDGRIGGWLLRRSSAAPDQVESGAYTLILDNRTDEAERSVR